MPNKCIQTDFTRRSYLALGETADAIVMCQQESRFEKNFNIR